MKHYVKLFECCWWWILTSTQQIKIPTVYFEALLACQVLPYTFDKDCDPLGIARSPQVVPCPPVHDDDDDYGHDDGDDDAYGHEEKGYLAERANEFCEE